MLAPSPFIMEWFPKIPFDGHVLDIACGKGRHTRAALDAGMKVTAIDKDTSGLRDLLTNPNLEIITSDLETKRWPLDARTFDAVIVTNYLWRPLFPYIVNAISSGGHVLYETFAIGNEKFGKPGNLGFLLQPGELINAFQDSCQTLEFWEGLEVDPKSAYRQRYAGQKR